jgi:hypothetical protein
MTVVESMQARRAYAMNMHVHLVIADAKPLREENMPRTAKRLPAGKPCNSFDFAEGGNADVASSGDRFQTKVSVVYNRSRDKIT